MKKMIQTDRAPQAIGPYSQAVEAGNTVYLSGQIPLDPATGQVVDDGWEQKGLPVESGSPQGMGYDALRQKVGGNSDPTG